MKKFSKLLDSALRRNGWNHELTIDLSELWWATKAWHITSTKEKFGHKLFLTFVGHPLLEGNLNFDDKCWAVVASDKSIVDRHDLTNCSHLLIEGRDYPNRVEEFVKNLDGFRSTLMK